MGEILLKCNAYFNKWLGCQGFYSKIRTSHALRSITLLLRNNDTVVDTIVSTAVSDLMRMFIRDLLKIQANPASGIVFCIHIRLLKQGQKKGQIQ